MCAVSEREREKAELKRSEIDYMERGERKRIAKASASSERVSRVNQRRCSRRNQRRRSVSSIEGPRMQGESADRLAAD